jgi:hypothetical protein
MSHRTFTLVVFGDSLSDNGNLFDLIGFPQPPAWEGRFSNGPVYTEQLASFLHMRLDDRAFGGAEASDLSPPLIVNPVTGQCPSSDNLRLTGISSREALVHQGLEFKRPAVDAASDGLRWWHA